MLLLLLLVVVVALGVLQVAAWKLTQHHPQLLGLQQLLLLLLVLA
jgi:hypothetical protein